ncbi:MAG: hypothetical protein AABX37_04250, partial [Nanoarchaeota archaeon]
MRPIIKILIEHKSGKKYPGQKVFINNLGVTIEDPPMTIKKDLGQFNFTLEKNIYLIYYLLKDWVDKDTKAVIDGMQKLISVDCSTARCTCGL